MDISKIKYFNLLYKDISIEYKKQLNILLSNSFNINSYELHDFTIITGFLLNGELIASMSLLEHENLKKLLIINDNNEMNGYSNKGDNGLFIYNVVVSKKYQRKHLAELLLKLAIKYSNNIKYLHCQVKKNNEPSFNLFFKCGFQIENEMEDNDNNIVCVMSRIL